MIKKLNRRIFSIIMISLLVITLGVINLFAFLNYRNTINASAVMMDRFGGLVERKDFENERPENFKPENPPERNQVEGVYSILIENSKVIENSDETRNEAIEQYALKLSKTKNETGIIGDYIYKIRKFNEITTEVMLMENREAILKAEIIIIVAVMLSAISTVIIYFIASKLSKTIVQPVESTFEKQKEFISDASHELKTPLAVIQANADVLENEIGENKWLGYIQKETESMNKLINELLTLTKIENIDTLRKTENINIADEISNAISRFESMAKENKVNVKSKLQESVIINGNKEDLEHILSTLIDNAIKHTKENGNVIVETKKEKNNAIIEVKNMGEPIPEEEREKIFERFYRIDKSRNRSKKRYGLGLAIARSIVEKYNGKIEVSYKDGYTIFKVQLPISKI